MVVIKENLYLKDNVFRKHNKKTIICNHCEESLIFFDIAPVSCCYCGELLLNMRRMINEQEYRLDYHFGATN